MQIIWQTEHFTFCWGETMWRLRKDCLEANEDGGADGVMELRRGIIGVNGQGGALSARIF